MITPRPTPSATSPRALVAAAVTALVLAAVSHLASLTTAAAPEAATALAEVAAPGTGAGEVVRVDDERPARRVAPVTGAALLVLVAALVAAPVTPARDRAVPVPLRAPVRSGRWPRRGPPA